MVEIWKWLASVPVVIGILAAATLATLGWMYTARRQRTLLRRQHTFDALLRASFNNQFQEYVHAASLAIREHPVGPIPGLVGHESADLRKGIEFLLNYYEFLAAGIRNGDISEQLLKDSEQSTILRLYEGAEEFIHSLRDRRDRQSTFEHIEWLCTRWKINPPAAWQRVLEGLIGRPVYHDHHRWWWVLAASIIIVAVAWILWWLSSH